MNYYTVMIPIAGHVTVSVEAETEREAIEMAFDKYDPSDATWETIEEFNRGNICYCPQPWSVTVVFDGEVEE